ncbi:PaaI family thioesterase [Pseudonocardia aurantiaca]|uniref:PaaI family thioesterase n=1 Tax=Pseudonocardia aurantiaca TaxID=75290 RepID=A0ABW4FQZ1_9PSEU
MSELDGHNAVGHPWQRTVPASDLRASKHRLAAMVRALIAETVLVDASRARAEDLLAVQVACEDLLRSVSALPSLRSRGGHHAVAEDRPLIERGPISGMSNPLAPPLVMSAVSGSSVVHATAVFGTAYEGPPNMVHGGVLLCVLDEVLAFGQIPSGAIGMTGTVTVKLIRPVPIGVRVDFEAGTESVEERKTRVWARALVDGQTAAEATAVCIRPRR